MKRIKHILESLNKIQESSEEELIKIAKESKNGTDFFEKLIYDYDFTYDDLDKFNIDGMDGAISYWKRVTKGGHDLSIDTNQWVEYPDKISQIKVSLSKMPQITVTYSNRISGEASNKHSTGEIYISDKFFRATKGKQELEMQLLAHELGHVMSGSSRSLREWIMKNPEGCLGLRNAVTNKWNGISYSPEESWAEALGRYVSLPNRLRSEYPKAYEFVKQVTKQIKYERLWNDVWTSYQDIIDNYR